MTWALGSQDGHLLISLLPVPVMWEPEEGGSREMWLAPGRTGCSFWVGGQEEGSDADATFDASGWEGPNTEFDVMEEETGGKVGTG